MGHHVRRGVAAPTTTTTALNPPPVAGGGGELTLDPPVPAPMLDSLSCNEASQQPKRKFYRTSDGRSLLTEGSFEQRERIAKDPEAGEQNLFFLARDQNSKWIEKVRKEEVLVGDRIAWRTGKWYTEEIVHDLREHIPNNPGVTPEIALYLGSRTEPYLAHAVLNGEHVDDATKNHVATTHKDSGVRSHGAKLGCLTSDSVAALAVDPDWRVAWAVAERNDIPLSVEPHLAQHPHSWVRRAFARNANSPEALKTLESDDERSVRRRASRRLRKLSK